MSHEQALLLLQAGFEFLLTVLALLVVVVVTIRGLEMVAGDDLLTEFPFRCWFGRHDFDWHDEHRDVICWGCGKRAPLDVKEKIEARNLRAALARMDDVR